MRYTTRLPKTNVNVSKSSHLKEMLLMLLAAVAVVVGAYWLLGMAVDVVAARISPDTEKRLAALFMDKTVFVELHAQAPPALTELVERVRTATTDISEPLTVFVSESDEVNAFAFPGGVLVFNQGLLDAVESENELTFIVGHELGHVQARDHLKGMGRGLVALVLSTLILGEDSSLSNALVNMMGLTSLNFTRAQETRADATGLKAMAALYGHANGVRQAFKDLGGRETGYLMRLHMTHPDNQKRLADLRDLADAMGLSMDDTQALTQRPDLSPP